MPLGCVRIAECVNVRFALANVKGNVAVKVLGLSWAFIFALIILIMCVILIFFRCLVALKLFRNISGYFCLPD